MSVAVKCPNCGKKYSLKEDSVGKKAKCTCGCVFRIARIHRPVEQENPSFRCNAIEDHSSEELSRENPSELVDRASVNQPEPPANEKSMASEVLIRLAYGSPGLIIIAICLYYTSGFLTALFAVVFGTIAFCITMYKGVSVHREEAAKRGMTFEQYQKEWRGRKPTNLRLRITTGIFYLSCILLMSWLVIPDEWAAKTLPDFAFAEHWEVALLILVLNVPVLLLVAAWLMGDWRKYLSVSGRLFLWHRLPFHYFFKAYWRTWTEMSREEVFGWAATNMVYIWACLTEYGTIKAVFLN